MQNNIYTSGEYICNHPTLDVEDTSWKLTKIVPLVDKFVKDSSLSEVTLLDVGGGAGLILKNISEYLKRMDINVKKYVLDLSKEMLQIQKENNPDVRMIINGDISETTSFSDKAIDLVLMIDVLEHVSDSIRALKELKRISRYVIFKVPLEDNLYYRVLNVIKRGGLRRDVIKKGGHINSYNFEDLKKQITTHTGEILCYYFLNVFEYYLSRDYQRQIDTKERVLYTLGKLTFGISPEACSRLFNDFVACLVKCK